MAVLNCKCVLTHLSFGKKPSLTGWKCPWTRNNAGLLPLQTHAAQTEPRHVLGELLARDPVVYNRFGRQKVHRNSGNQLVGTPTSQADSAGFIDHIAGRFSPPRCTPQPFEPKRRPSLNGKPCGTLPCPSDCEAQDGRTNVPVRLVACRVGAKSNHGRGTPGLT